MSFSLFYIVNRLFYRILQFLRHWYIKSGKVYSDRVLDLLGKIDYYLAWRITLKHLFQPLYGDYTFLGYVLGISFRLVRLFLGAIFYGVIFLIVIGAYALWLITPVYLVYLIFKTII